MIATKTALKESGDYDPTGGRIGAWQDEGTTEALKTVQRRNRIWPDGRMKKNSPTHRVINAERKERAEGRKPSGLGLGGSVGEAGSNRDGDVRKVRGALGQLGYLDKKEAAHPGGTFDYPAAAATRTFQTAYNLKPDGRADPGGPTDTMLSRVTGPLSNTANPEQPPAQAIKARAQKTGQASNPVLEASKSRGVFRPEYTQYPSPFQKPEDKATAAEAILHGLAGASRWAGMTHAPDNLEHFLGGTGMDRELPRDEVRKRTPVEIGEPRNRQSMERAFTTFALTPPGSRGKTNVGYAEELLRMQDGDEIVLSGSNGHEARMSFGGRNSPVPIDKEEQWASGRTTVQAKTVDGFRAVRRGDRIFVFGTVEHRWDDDYDFKGKGVLTNLALTTRDGGRAREYRNLSHWRQGLFGELKIENGELIPVRFDWHDQLPETRLK